ncbi:MAG: hypothetical protein M5R40_08005 [Anaerolineae bacterium]|nr:hypothetical protein [Anaerolineae bacterium]
MDEDARAPYGRFFKLYTFRYLESHAASDLLLQVSIATLRYGAAALRAGADPAEGADAPGSDLASWVRRAVFPRWRALLNIDDPFKPLGLEWDENLRLRAGWPELARYRERRALDNTLAGYLQRAAPRPRRACPSAPAMRRCRRRRGGLSCGWRRRSAPLRSSTRCCARRARWPG